jgi:hypothetical protein
MAFASKSPGCTGVSLHTCNRCHKRPWWGPKFRNGKWAIAY